MELTDEVSEIREVAVKNAALLLFLIEERLKPALDSLQSCSGWASLFPTRKHGLSADFYPIRSEAKTRLVVAPRSDIPTQRTCAMLARGSTRVTVEGQSAALEVTPLTPRQ